MEGHVVGQFLNVGRHLLTVCFIKYAIQAGANGADVLLTLQWRDNVGTHCRDSPLHGKDEDQKND